MATKDKKKSHPILAYKRQKIDLYLPNFLILFKLPHIIYFHIKTFSILSLSQFEDLLIEIETMKSILTSDTTISSCSKLTIHKDSYSISKLKPKIRIIHIIAPEIIKTDVENFRDLVQRLTGKHAVEGKGIKKRKRKDLRIASSQVDNPQMNMLHRIKEESEKNSSHGFGMEGFIQELGKLSAFPFKSTHINMYGEMHAPLLHRF